MLSSLNAFIFVSGRGVFATRSYREGDFLLEYRGVLTDAGEGTMSPRVLVL